MRHTLMRCPWCGLDLWRHQTTEDTTSVEFHEYADCKHCGYHYQAAFDHASGNVVTTITAGRGVRQYDVENQTLGPPEEMPHEDYLAIVRQAAEARRNEKHDDEWWFEGVEEAEEEKRWKAVEEAEAERKRWRRCDMD